MVNYPLLAMINSFLQKFDINRNGTLEKLEFEEFLSKLGIFLARQELTAVYNAFDVNQDGKIQYDEFINVLRVITLAVFNPS